MMKDTDNEKTNYIHFGDTYKNYAYDVVPIKIGERMVGMIKIYEFKRSKNEYSVCAYDSSTGMTAVLETGFDSLEQAKEYAQQNPHLFG